MQQNKKSIFPKVEVVIIDSYQREFNVSVVVVYSIKVVLNELIKHNYNSYFQKITNAEEMIKETEATRKFCKNLMKIQETLSNFNIAGFCDEMIRLFMGKILRKLNSIPLVANALHPEYMGKRFNDRQGDPRKNAPAFFRRRFENLDPISMF